MSLCEWCGRGCGRVVLWLLVLCIYPYLSYVFTPPSPLLPPPPFLSTSAARIRSRAASLLMSARGIQAPWLPLLFV